MDWKKFVPPVMLSLVEASIKKSTGPAAKVKTIRAKVTRFRGALTDLFSPATVTDMVGDCDLDQAVLNTMWMSDAEKASLDAAIAVFDSRVSSGPVRGSVDISTSMDGGWSKLVDYSPATNAQEAARMVQSGEYRWIFKSAHDNSGDKGTGFKLREVVGKAVPKVVPDPYADPNQECTEVSQIR